MKLEFSTTVGILEHLPGIHYLHIPAEIVAKLGGTMSKRLLCTVNQKLQFQGGLVALGNGGAYISITQKRMKEIGAKLGDTVKLCLEPDKSQYGMQMPRELETLLSQDEEGMLRFKKLTPGRQRYVIFYINAVKSSDKRIERAVLLIENLKKLPMGKESLREMMGLPPR